MILTGTEIEKQVSAGNICLAPFDRRQLNPNSYNYRLGPLLRLPQVDVETGAVSFETTRIPEMGYVLHPGTMMLGHTLESVGSRRYAMSLIGRSSLGRLGLFLQVSANLGHTTSDHCWTLELVAALPIRLYAGMMIGQVSFWSNQGDVLCLGKTYANYSIPTEKIEDDSDRT